MSRDERIRFIFRKRRRFAPKDAAKILSRSERWVGEPKGTRRVRPQSVGKGCPTLILLVGARADRSCARSDGGKRLSGRSFKLTVRISRHKVIALRYQARRRRIDASEIVADCIDVFRDETEGIETDWPEYMEAWHLPYRPRRPNAIPPKVETKEGARA